MRGGQRDSYFRMWCEHQSRRKTRKEHLMVVRMKKLVHSTSVRGLYQWKAAVEKQRQEELLAQLEGVRFDSAKLMLRKMREGAKASFYHSWVHSYKAHVLKRREIELVEVKEELSEMEEMIEML